MRVLLVEDDSRIANFVAKGLRENSYAVDIAIDGEEAAYMASINPYDLFVLDVNLPKKDGFEVCSELRENGNKKPVVGFIAGQTAPPGRRMGHAGAIIGGADDTAAAKMKIMKECGIFVVESPAEIGETMVKALSKK